jgi:type IV secretory pathway TrbL component
MADLSVIDRFTDTFSRYIDFGFGLLSGDVTFLSSTLVVVDPVRSILHSMSSAHSSPSLRRRKVSAT